MGNLTRTPAEGEIYQPWELLREEFRERARLYYGDGSSDATIVSRIYGGKPLAPRFSRVELTVIDAASRVVTFRIVGVDGGDIVLSEISFRQLLVESSILPPAGSDWDSLETQQRLEICQNELARWSVLFGRKFFQAPTDVEQVELVNNCTTSKGFEIKVHLVGGEELHGSVTLPQDTYRELSAVQAGAWARQGWSDQDDHDLLPSAAVKRCFGRDIYNADAHADPLIRLDLLAYRQRSQSWVVTGFRPELGVIDYDGLASLTGNREYVEKPRQKGLVATADAGAAVRRAPPTTYVDARLEPAAFRLPNFGVEGLYEVFSTVEKKHYWQLSQLNEARIWSTGGSFFELELERLAATDLQLHRILLGNLNLARDLPVGGVHTVDRFCFAPRPTVSEYDPGWRPAREENIESPPYAWILARGDRPDEGVFIQAESWGVERAVLHRPATDRLIVDLISFERIVPVWRCELDLPKLAIEALEG